MKYRLLSSIYYEDVDLYKQKYSNRYNSDSTYRFDFQIGENKAFIVINNNILQSVEKIHKLDKQFDSKIHALPNIALRQYTKKCIIDEIKMTNDIEGVISTRKEIGDILDDIKGNKKGNRLYGLVKKYELLTEEDIPFNNCTDIRKLYDELVLQEVKSENMDHVPDGVIFRKDNVYIQNKTGKTIHKGVFPESKIIEVLTECLSMLKNESYNKLISLAVFHYMFGYVHPFYDGNGRISRFISSYLLAREVHPLISYRLAYTIKKDIDGYYKSFRIVNDEKNMGEITSFVEYFLEVLINSLEDLNASLQERIVRLTFYEGKINVLSHNGNIIDERTKSILYILVQNTLFGENGLSAEELIEIVEAGNSKVRSSLRVLEQMEVIEKSKIGKKYLYDVQLNFLDNYS